MAQVLIAGLLMLALVACQTSTPAPAPKPYSEMTLPERCANLALLMGNPYLSALQQAAAYEKARNEGCMNATPTQQVR